MYGLTSAFLLPAARKRASDVWDAQLFAEFILGQLMPDVLSYLCLILTHRVDIVTTPPELPITIFELQLADCSYIITLLFPFKYPTNADTPIFCMRQLLCVAHWDLLLICLWAQLPDRTSFLANQKECL